MFYILGQMWTQTFRNHSYIFGDGLSQFCDNLLLQKSRYLFDASDSNEFFSFVFICLFIYPLGG